MSAGATSAMIAGCKNCKNRDTHKLKQRKLQLDQSDSARHHRSRPQFERHRIMGASESANPLESGSKGARPIVRRIVGVRESGKGEVKTARTVCFAIRRDILREARQSGDSLEKLRDFRILAAQTVVDLFLEEEAQSLTMLSDFIGKPISMQVECVHSQEQYDMVLVQFGTARGSAPQCN
jgi:hypothetical protein